MMSDHEMLRTYWEFPHKAKDLIGPTRAKVTLHKARLAHWTREFAKLRKKLGAAGIKLVGGDMFEKMQGSSNYNQPNVMIDNAIQQELQTAGTKMKEHAAKLKEYETWLRTLTRHPSQTLNLTHYDVVFFGL